MKSRTLLFVMVGAMLAAAATLVWYATRSPGEAPPVFDRTRTEDVATPRADVGPEVASTPSAAAASAVREEVAATAAASTALDPSIEAALCGFRGRVVDHTGEPQPGLLVALYRMSLDSVMQDRFGEDVADVMEPQIDAGNAATGPDGTFEITGVWPQAFYALRAGVGADVSRLMILDQSPGPGEIVDLGDVRLDQTATIVGTVVDESGAPLAGARIRAIDLPATIASMVSLDRFDENGVIIITEGGIRVVVEFPKWVARRLQDLPIPYTSADSEGRFRLTNVTSGEWMVVVSSGELRPGLLPNVRAKAGDETDVGQVELREGDEVWGKVLDQSGRPVEGAQVVVGQLSAMAPVAFGSYAESTNGRGEFSLAGFRGGRVIAAARRHSGDPWVVGDPQPAAKDLELRLPSVHGLTLRVADEDGKPVAGLRLRMYPAGPDSDMGPMMAMGFMSTVPLEDRFKPQGDGRYRVEPLAAGAYRVEAWADGYAVLVTEVEVLRDTDIPLRLTREVGGSVLVRTTDGEPVRSAAVYAAPDGGNDEIPQPLGRTGTDGRLELHRVAPGPTELMAHHPAFGWVAKETELPTPEELVFEYAAPGHIRGTCFEGADPPEVGKWMILVQKERDENGGAMLPSLAAPDLEGNFEVRGLQPGEYRLMPVPSMRGFSSFGNVATLMQSARMFGEPDRTTVVVRSGATAEVQLELGRNNDVVDGPSAMVTGSVLVDGAAGSGLIVTQRWRGRAATVDDSGRFDLGAIPVGNAHVQVIDPNSRSSMMGTALWSKRLEIKENENVDLTIDLRLGSIEGMVVLPDGSSAGRCPVRIEGELEGEGEAELAVAANDDGRFTAERVPAGVFEIEVENRDGRGRLADVQVSGGSKLSGLRVVLNRTYTVRGTMNMEAMGSPPPDWAWLQLRGTEGQSTESDSIDDDGTFEVDGLEPGTYTAEINVYYREPKPDNEWHSRSGKFVHQGNIEVRRDLDGLVLRPVPAPKKKKTKKTVETSSGP
ncbi:MAG: hypothetical protein AAF628_09360 [Planctomycetota bacterium]